MSHEVYYTSAPQGLRRHSSGFCTVAASENIPKALWDRMESLSAYRHHFGVGGEANPVSHAHWILVVTGRTHHVLSRVCDSGMDHTQRTNAFAHHLVLDTAEMAAAAGGPAWMLEQPGVMAEAWDGRVGALARGGEGPLPRGDSAAASRICRAWQAATGDAGWGGHLADVFVKTPARPVCILFTPGQEMLALMAETIALLPPTARWNVTFNTYFTSMPTSATCAWRCCVAGSPAAQVGLRYAASGLVIDLTDRARLGSVPAGPYVTAARTGTLPVMAAARAMPSKAAVAINKGKTQSGKPTAGTLDAQIELEEMEEEARRDRIFEFADEPEGGKTSAEMEPIAEGEGEIPLQDENPVAARPAESASKGDGQDISPGTPNPQKDEVKRAADRDLLAARRRRRHIFLLFAAAAATIAVGSGLILLAQRRPGIREEQPATAPSHVPPPDLQVKREQTAALISAYKEALAGYKELTGFDVALEMADGMPLATLHFQRAAVDAGK